MFNKQPCVVDLMGHVVVAGFLSEQAIGGASFIRLDVPEIEGQKAYTKFYGPSAVYSITPVDHETMLTAVRAYCHQPIDVYRLVVPVRQQIPAGPDDPFDEHFGDDDDEVDL